MKVKVSGDSGADVLVALTDKSAVIGRATQAAMKDLSVVAKERGRAAIAKGGFGAKWQAGLRSQYYKNFEINAAVYVWHKIPHALAFEQGATIRGKSGKLRKLWIPLSTTPKHLGPNKVSPSLLQQRGFDLFAKTIRGKVYLMGTFGASRATANRSGKRGGRGVIKSIPLFVGVDTVTLKKRFDVRDAVKSAAGQLPALYVKHFKDD